MNADAFRHLYEYHFSENRRLWGLVCALTQEQYTQPAAYSRGSVRDQVVHLISADRYWFSGLRGAALPDDLDPADFDDRNALRAQWDGVEQTMQAYLAGLRDEMLFDRPLGGEDEIVALWQVLIHVINHGTDHRAQILRLLNDLGVQTTAQDYIFYIFDHTEQ